MDPDSRREWQQDERTTPAGEARPEGRTGDELMRLLSGIVGSAERAAPAAPTASGRVDPIDGARALDRVQRMAGALQASHERARELEERVHAIIERATRELDASHARIAALETSLREAEAREKRAEARAREAEDYLQRIYHTASEDPSEEATAGDRHAEADADAGEDQTEASRLVALRVVAST